ncbi:type II toxin-antitoxin system RelE/ParE family toxin [Intrasporangium sp.]|uniref:type II toxin-antitoxin system RelE family toxin n=1 Tax=Intrasporangium sp. TaxID=1925024 RepID=UPI00322168AB
MSRWQLQTSSQFDRAARRADRAVLRRVRAYLDEVCELDDPRDRGKGLSATRAGYWRYRVGDWRVVVEIRDAELVIVAIGLGAPLGDLPRMVNGGAAPTRRVGPAGGRWAAYVLDGQDRPTMPPSAVMSMRSAFGAVGRPGIVLISPQIA